MPANINRIDEKHPAGAAGMLHGRQAEILLTNDQPPCLRVHRSGETVLQTRNQSQFSRRQDGISSAEIALNLSTSAGLSTLPNSFLGNCSTTNKDLGRL